jgi:UDP-2,3-diacylglucosamine pyrophosphatase LpxH
MTKYKTIIVSDIHLGTKDSQTKEFIKFLDEHPTEQLILNGDIIDGWALQRGSKWKNQHTKVILKLLEVSKKTNIVWIRGNHDEFLTDFFMIKISNITMCEEYVIEINNKKYFIFHGDILDVFSSTWKWVAKIGSVGYDLALALNTTFNNIRAKLGLPYYSISKQIKAKVKSAVSFIADFEENATKLAIQHKCGGVICGHIHTAEDRTINGIHYLNSGDWVESKTAILIDKKDNIYKFGF